MSGFDASKESLSGPLDKTGAMAETPEVNWVSEGSTNSFSFMPFAFMSPIEYYIIRS